MNERVKKLLKYLLARRKEPTSVVSYVMMIGLVTGHALTPELVAGWTTIGIGVSGVILYLWPELGEE